MTVVPSVSVVLPTYNRSVALVAAVDSVLTQTAVFDSYEVLVIDNNSTDDTATVVAEIARRSAGRVRHLTETRQGVAYARQAGIDAARAPVIALFDDDVLVSEQWVETIQRRFARHADVDCLGGKVLPRWQAAPPSWLTADQWAPLALQDHGDRDMEVSLSNPRCLISANLACRRQVFDQIGGFSPQFQRVKDSIGSLEDDEWIRRFWKSEMRALYVPELVTYTDVPLSRMTRAYHRRWHLGHGRFYALMRAEEIERSAVGAPLGVPAHLYRSAFVDAAGWIGDVFQRRTARAFAREMKLRFFTGFVQQRVRNRGHVLSPDAESAHDG